MDRTYLTLSILSNPFQYFIRIERVAQAVTDVVYGDDGEEDHQAGENRQPGIFCEVILCGVDQVAPVWTSVTMTARVRKSNVRDFVDIGPPAIFGLTLRVPAQKPVCTTASNYCTN